MELRIFVEPQQGASYQTLLEAAQASEAAGFGAFFRSDHFSPMGSADGLPGPTDAWTTLAGLARETTTIRLGTLVTSATFRLPGVLAVQVAQVDEMSGGRVELGLGAGWYKLEHTAYGIPFPPLGERFDRLTEQLAIITGMWAADGPFTYRGEHYSVVDSPALPKPVQSQVPVIVGGRGPKRTPALAAQFATEFNLPFASIEATAAQFDRVRAVAGGRELAYSAAQIVCCGRTPDELGRRAAAIGREVDELRESGVAGTPAECVARLRAFADIGASRAYLQVMDLHDLDHLALIGAEVLPALA